MRPAREAFGETWPEAYCYDFLDTSLAVDRADAGILEPAMADRIRQLSAYAASTVGRAGRTAGILFTCSAFGPAIDEVKETAGIPVLRPNEAAFEEALESGTRIALVVTFEPSAVSLSEEMRRMAGAKGKSIELSCMLAEGALAALKRGDGDEHDRLVAKAAGCATGADIIVLGQFSMARAREAVRRIVAAPVITSPHSSVEKLRRMLEESKSRAASL